MTDRRDPTRPQDADAMTEDLLNHVPTPRAAELKAWEQAKRERDAVRVRLRLDVPDWLKGEIEDAAGAEAVSWSQFGAFLLAAGLERWQAGDPELRARFEGAKHEVASLRWRFGIDLTDFETRPKRRR